MKKVLRALFYITFALSLSFSLLVLYFWFIADEPIENPQPEWGYYDYSITHIGNLKIAPRSVLSP